MAVLAVDLPTQIRAANRNELGYRVLHPSAVIRNEEDGSVIEVPFSSYTEKYRDYLSKHMRQRYLTEKDCAKYRFRPKTFSYDMYGSVEFWNDILVLNNCTSIRDFQPAPNRPVRYYDPSYLKTYINEILIIESQIKI